jgi:hypothetical protein
MDFLTKNTLKDDYPIYELYKYGIIIAGFRTHNDIETGKCIIGEIEIYKK